MDGTPHILSRDDILKAELDDQGRPLLPWENVHVPEWGGNVVVQGLTGRGRDKFEGMLVRQRGKKFEQNLDNFRTKLLAMSIVDSPGGKLLFTELDVPVLASKSASAIERVYNVAVRLSRLSPDDVEELTEELGEDPNADSGSDSLDTSDSQLLSANNG
jgi:hypothetical protein